MTSQEMLNDVWPICLALLSAVASFAMLWLTKKSNSWVNAQNNQSYDDVIDQACMGGIAFGQQTQANSDIRNEAVQAAIVASAFAYAKGHATEAIIARGITDAILRQKIIARLAPALMAAAAVGGQVSVAAAATAVNPNIPTTPLEFSTR